MSISSTNIFSNVIYSPLLSPAKPCPQQATAKGLYTTVGALGLPRRPLLFTSRRIASDGHFATAFHDAVASNGVFLLRFDDQSAMLFLLHAIF